MNIKFTVLVFNRNIHYTFKNTQIHFCIKLPIWVVHDGPDPPVCPIAAPHGLVVRPEVRMIINPHTNNHKECYSQEVYKITQLQQRKILVLSNAFIFLVF